MIYVSPYRLAAKLDWRVEWIDEVQIAELIEKVKELDEPIFEYDDHIIGKAETIEFLTSIQNPLSVKFCLWINSIEALEILLHEQSLRSDKDFEISQELQYSGQLDGLKHFVQPFLEQTITKMGVKIVEERKFDDFYKLDKAWKFLNDSAGRQQIEANFAAALTQFFEDQIFSASIVPAEELTFLQGFEFVDFCNAWKFGDESRSILLKKIKEWEPLLRRNAEERLVASILTNLQGIDGLEFQLHFGAPKHDRAKAQKKALDDIRQKQKQKQDKNKKAGLMLFAFIGICVIVILVIRNRKFDSVSDHTDTVYYDDDDGGVSYSLEDEDEFYDFDDEFEYEPPTYTIHEWREQIDIIQDYVDETKRPNAEKVNSYKEYHTLADEEELSNPFIEFFYPLHAKDGANTFNIENNSNYGCIIMVRAHPDCYSYFIPSKSTSTEKFSLIEGDELVFFIGREYIETPDLELLNNAPAGFVYTDNNSKELLRYSYKVGASSKGDDTYYIEISPHSSPTVIISPELRIKTYKDGNKY